MKPTLLIVDDENNILTSIKRVLKNQYYDIVTVDSGEKALQLLADNDKSIQVVVSDQRMPEMTGLELMLEIKKNYPKIIRILLSGYSDFEVIKQAINEGSIYRYLTKPWNNESLRNTIGEAFSAYNTQAESEQEIETRINTEIQKLQHEFMQNMSHEIRTPLNSLIGFSEILSNDMLDLPPQDQKKCLKKMLASSQSLSKLLTNILDLEDAENSKIKTNVTNVNLEILINEVVTTLQEELQTKNIQLSVVVHPELKTLKIEALNFKKVVFEYLTNAIKFARQEGKIEISIRPESPSSFSLNVKDNGIGIPLQKYQGVFVPFKQLDMSLTKEYQGAGVGLALVRLLVEQQGGSVGFESKEGEGSLFYAIFPFGK